MRKQQLITAFGAAAGMLILILDSKTALSGTAEGIELCIRTLIPSLFPFFILSILLTGALTGQSLRLLRPVGKLCSIPCGAESLLAIGLLGGYPVGAQNVCIAYRRGRISRKDAQRMIAFCNNAGPAFLFGIIAPLFSDVNTAWLLWAIHIISAIAVGIILPGTGNAAELNPTSGAISLPEALEKAIKTMSLVCGWVILFRMILAILDRWIFWALPLPVSVMLSGLLELSNGCVRLGSVEAEGLRFLIANILLSLGGCCVILQTLSICTGVSLHLYFPGKILQCGISLFLGIAMQSVFPVEEQFRISPILWLLIGLFCGVFSIMLRKKEKTSSIPSFVGV